LMLELKDVSKLLKSLDIAIKDSTLDQKTIETYELAIDELVNADKKMWDWMHNFDIAYQADRDSTTLVYFKNQFIKIDSVRLLFESSISTGEELVSN
ncbi:hypothetical protein MNBD_BACTEROID06-1341, partial [hydrothermal vent metagenome]